MLPFADDSYNVSTPPDARPGPEQRGITIPMKWIAPSLLGGIVLDRWETQASQGTIGSNEPPRPSNPGPYNQPIYAPTPVRPYRFFSEPDFLPRHDAKEHDVKKRSASVTSSPPKHELQARAARPWVWIAPSLLVGSLFDRFLFGHHRAPRPASQAMIPQTPYPYSPYAPPVASPYIAGRPVRQTPPTEIYPRGFEPAVFSKMAEYAPEAAAAGKSLLGPLAITGSSLGMEGMLESTNDYTPAYRIRADRPSEIAVRKSTLR